MRKDTLIMTLTMVIVTVGVYYGLEIFLRGDGDAKSEQFSVSAPPTKVINTDKTQAAGAAPEEFAEEDETAGSGDGLEEEIVEVEEEPADESGPEVAETDAPVEEEPAPETMVEDGGSEDMEGMAAEESMADGTEESMAEGEMAEAPAGEEPAEEMAAMEEPAMVDPPAAASGSDSSVSEDELTEIAVQAAIDEAVKAAAEAAEKAVREAMEARRAATQ